MTGHFFGTRQELWLFGCSILLGAVMGSVYDVFRALRRSIKHHGAVIFCEDLVFSLAFAFSYYCFCLELCFGALRGFVLAGMAIGFITYIYTFGIFISDFFTTLLSAVVIFFKKTHDVLLRMQHFKKREEKLDKPS